MTLLNTNRLRILASVKWVSIKVRRAHQVPGSDAGRGRELAPGWQAVARTGMAGGYRTARTLCSVHQVSGLGVLFGAVSGTGWRN